MTSHDENHVVELWTVLSDKSYYLFASVCCKGGVGFPVSWRIGLGCLVPFFRSPYCQM